ncbi:RNA polymerase sigma-70 factor (ECF subfamily) [Sphingopyxis sp. OAS728]|uniref:RNA polymerase sigma factor n=1 Tax=Sphingopyxis sp. OAS728 TaxID=2663823 RepID=UPI00178BDAF0|nr:RNA polymerase sigma factor [Sphingopyxis sp. OAS728]MBE1525969.1 RNA polymerase sigma-70 factor (ECF subfamily) [Sphingopyxis sp. OAS728]
MLTGAYVGRGFDTETAERDSPLLPGSTAAFAAFYRAEEVRLFHYFRRRVGREAAPDLVQEAFTRMFRSGAFGKVEHPRAYLARTAHNLLIERARTWHRKQRMLCPLDEARDASVPPEQHGQIEAAELRRALRKALLAMPRRTRRIFLMHRLRNHTYAQIAEELGLSAKTVEKHISRALHRCRKVAVRYA